jgi:hypothetical protein
MWCMGVRGKSIHECLGGAVDLVLCVLPVLEGGSCRNAVACHCLVHCRVGKVASSCQTGCWWSMRRAKF